MLDKILSGKPERLGKLAGGQYYQEIPKLDDLATTVLRTKKSKIVLQQIRIQSSRIPLDELVERCLEDLSQQLFKLNVAPAKDDIISKTVTEIVTTDNLGNNAQKILKKELQRLGHTGKLVQATKKLNSSGLSNTDRQILSKEGILFYTTYRAVIGFETLDTAGINTNILDSLGKVKSHINQVLVDKVIEQLNLEVSDAERQDLKEILSERVISYEKGEVERAILVEFEKIKSAGSLIDLVIDFLNSDEVELPFDADINQIAEKMVQYLVDIGYDPERADPLEEIIETRLTEIQTSIDSQKAELEQLIEEKLNQANQERTDLREQLTSSLEQKTTELTGQLTQLETKQTTDINEINSKIADVSNAQTNQQEQLAELTDKLTQLEGKQTTDINEINSKIADVSNAQTNQQEQLTKLTRDNTEAIKGLEELGMKQLQDNEKAIQERKEIQATIDDLKDKTTEIDQAVKDIAQLRMDFSENKDLASKERADLTTKATDAEKTIKKLETNDKKITNDAKAERAKLKTLINNLQTQVNDLQKQIDDLLGPQ